MLRRGLVVAALTGGVLAGLFAPAGARAQSPVPVDVELVLAVEASADLDDTEIRLLRNGYAAALESPEVQLAIASGIHRRIVVLFMEWGGPDSQPVIVDWRSIEGPASAADFALALRRAPRQAVGEDALAAGVARAAEHIETNTYSGRRKVIDLTGDGPEANADEMLRARNRAVARGIAINATAIERPGRSETPRAALVHAYATDVAGGPESFVVTAGDPAGLANAIRRKLVQEIGGPTFLQDLERRWGARAWSALPGPR